MGMIRKGRKRLGATSDSPRSQAGVGKETLGGCRECHGETPRHELLFEATEVGADVRFVERDGLHQRRRFMLELADAQAQFERLWPLADLFLQPKVRSAPEAAGPEDARRERWIDQSALTSFAREERRGGRDGGGSRMPTRPVDRCQRPGTKDCSSARRNLLSPNTYGLFESA